MDIRKTFATDSDKEQNGVWAEIGDGASLLIARFGNPAFTAEISRLRKPYKQQIARGTLPEDVSMKLLIQAMCKTVLLGWKGITDAGKEVAYSYEKAIEFMTELKEFRDMVSTLSMEMELFKQEVDEEIEGN